MRGPDFIRLVSQSVVAHRLRSSLTALGIGRFAARVTLKRQLLGGSLLLALGWGAVRSWLADVERYAASTLARATRLLRAAAPPVRRRLAGDERAPRRLYGDVFESRPPPLPA